MIFFASVLVVNGGTTFLIRSCRELNRNGHRSAVLVLFDKSDPGMVAALQEHADIYYMRDFLVGPGRWMPSRLHPFAPFNIVRLSETLHAYGSSIHVMSIFGAIVAERLAATACFSMTVGVYHQMEYMLDEVGKPLQRLAARLLDCVPARNFVFFNDITRTHYAEYFDRDLSDSAILPIGIDLPAIRTDYTPCPGKIVSIGSLVGFKTYNAHIIDTVALLRDEIDGISYHIYGTGPEEPALQQRMADREVEDIVFLHGLADYSRLPDLLGDAAAFVGSGTAILEAAALGIPSIIGIETMEEPETYGFIYEVPSFSYNERGIELPKRRFEDILRHLLNDPAQIQVIGAQCRKKAETFSIRHTMAEMLERAETAPQNQNTLSRRQRFRMSVSFLFVLAKHIFGMDRSFQMRRNKAM